MNIKNIINELTVEEKAALVAGTDFMFTNPIPRLGIPSVRTSDGPHGLRVQKEGGDNGVTGSEPATAFPTAAAIASSWNPENAELMGAAIAEECLYYGVNVLLGPGANIKRNPLGGRNFEYFSEDPLLSGKMAAAEIRGIQSKGVGASLKHFALNNSENYRFVGNSICDERTMREIYLKSFEIAVAEGKPQTVMCAYNKIDGTFCSQNKKLLTGILRSEWGFNGLVMTDWGATHDRIEMLRAGLDLEMPGDTAICRKWIIDGIASGKLAMPELDKAVENVISLVELHRNDEKTEAGFTAHNILAAEIAADSAVLLKNDGILPLDRNEEYCVVGELFRKPRYQGSGSSMINPACLTSPESAFNKRGVRYTYAKGYSENQVLTDDNLLKQAESLARNYEKVLVFAGLTDYTESEGCDRENMRLPQNQLDLIRALVKAGRKVIVILYGGAPVELPFADDVGAILNMYLPGQNGGEAMASLVFGERTPCGKLAETWPLTYDDVPFGKDFSEAPDEVYKESVFVGYRYYLTAGKKVRYPFGYGLSYTSFEYADMKLSETESQITATATVSNTGQYDGAETVQLYVRAPQGVFKPFRELRGFTKVYLKAGESKQVTVTVKKEDLCYWNPKEHRPVAESGEYIFELCSDCLTVKLSQPLSLRGEQTTLPYSDEINGIYRKADAGNITDGIFERMSGLRIPAPSALKPITTESRFSDLNKTLTGRLLYKSVLSVAGKDMKKALKMPEGTERDNKIKGALFLKRILNGNSLISMSMSAGKSFPYNFAQGFANLSNGHIFKGIGCFLKKIKVPALPKNKEEK